MFEIHVRVTDQHSAYFQKSFLVSVLNEVEDLDVDGVEDHYDLDDDGDGQTDELEIRLGLDSRMPLIMLTWEWCRLWTSIIWKMGNIGYEGNYWRMEERPK